MADYPVKSYTNIFALPAAAGGQPPGAQVIVDQAPVARTVVLTASLLDAGQRLILIGAGVPVPYARVAFTEDGAGGFVNVPTGITGQGKSPRYYLLAPGALLPLMIPQGKQMFASINGDATMGASFIAISHTEAVLVEPAADGQTERIVAGIRQALLDSIPPAIVRAAQALGLRAK